MNSLKHFSAALLLAVVATTTLAAEPPMPPSAANMDMQMSKMQAMHDKMMAAKKPQERQKLMGEQMQAMQQGMAMMQAMDKDMMAKGMMPCQGMAGSAADAKAMMDQRMKMMDMMQQMMGPSGGAMPMPMQ